MLDQPGVDWTGAGGRNAAFQNNETKTAQRPLLAKSEYRCNPTPKLSTTDIAVQRNHLFPARSIRVPLPYLDTSVPIASQSSSLLGHYLHRRLIRVSRTTRSVGFPVQQQFRIPQDDVLVAAIIFLHSTVVFQRYTVWAFHGLVARGTFWVFG